MKDHLQIIKERLERVKNTYLEVLSISLISIEGFPVFSNYIEGIDETKMAGISSVIFNLAELSNYNLNKGFVENIFIKCSECWLQIYKLEEYICFIAISKDFNPYQRYTFIDELRKGY